MTPRSGLAVTVSATVATAAVALFAVTRTWQTQTRERPFPLPAETVTTVGTAVAPWALAAGLVVIAAALALFATGGAARRLVVAVIAAGGGGLAAAGVFGAARLPGVWPILTALAGVGIVLIAVWSWSRAADWPRMSARYERGESDRLTAAGDDDGDIDPARLWDAIDRGRDPTK